MFLYSDLVAPYDIAIITACSVLQANKVYTLQNESAALAGCVKGDPMERRGDRTYARGGLREMDLT